VVLPTFEAVVPVKYSNFLRELSPEHFVGPATFVQHSVLACIQTYSWFCAETEAFCWTGWTHCHSGSSGTQVTASDMWPHSSHAFAQGLQTALQYHNPVYISGDF